MKTLKNELIKAICLVLIMSTTSIFSQSTTEPASRTSFYNALNAINWDNFSVKDGLEDDLSCYPDFLAKIRQMTKVTLEDKVGEPYNEATKLLRSVQEILEKHDFDEIQIPKMPFSKFPLRDHLLNSLQGDYKFDFNFQDTFQGNGRLDDKEYEDIMELYREFKNRDGVLIQSTSYRDRDLNCRFTMELFMKLENFDFARGRANWRVRKQIAIDCDCIKRKGSNKGMFDLDNGFTILETFVNSSLKIENLKHTTFTKRENVEMVFLNYMCCNGEQSEDKDPNESDPNEGGGEGDGGEENGDGSSGGDPVDKDKDCCDESQDKNSIGFFPVLNFGNNLEDSTIGISIEYLHNMGNSFGNNEWYAGLQGTYATSSAQGGELTENFYSGAVIVENRTPILPCVKWVQRVSGEFGQGTLEAFGNTDDFTHYSIDLRTGATFDLTSNFSVAIDAALLEIGSQTFKPTNGPEIKTDITNLYVPPQDVRFGFRFFF